MGPNEKKIKVKFSALLLRGMKTNRVGIKSTLKVHTTLQQRNKKDKNLRKPTFEEVKSSLFMSVDC